MKILNLFAGIGGNRKLWNEVVKDIEVTAIEFDKNIAKAYQDRYPNDKVIVACAKEYLLENYKEFDFIWASPPCQSHSRVRKCKVDCKNNKFGKTSAVYPDMSLYQLIIFLQNHFKGKFVVENVKPYYEPLIKPTLELDRHLYWSNYFIPQKRVSKKVIIENVTIDDLKDIDLRKYKIKNKIQVIRNQVDFEVGKHILNYAIGKESLSLFDFKG